MTQMLGGKVAIVTGAGGGIGAVVAALLAERGATAILTDIDAARVEAAAAAIRETGRKAVGMAFDLAREEEIADAVRRIVADQGRIDIIHNNAALQTEEQRAKDLDVVHLDTRAWDDASRSMRAGRCCSANTPCP